MVVDSLLTRFQNKGKNYYMSDVRQLINKQQPLSAAIRSDILQKAKENSYDDGKLPSEDELCVYYNVSRATIREALAILHREGFISKRHGKGTFINYSAVHAVMRFDLEIILPQILEQAGYTVSTKRAPLQVITDRNNLRSFYINSTINSQPVLEQLTKHIVKDGIAIITYNYFSYYDNLPVWDNCLNFKDMVNAVTGKTLSHTIQAFIPMLAPAEVAEAFRIEANPVIMWHQKHYTVDDEPVCESYVFFNPQIVLLHSLTRWL